MIDRDFEYLLDDACLPKFLIKGTGDDWWREKSMVRQLIFAFKMALPFVWACSLAGITPDQYSEFLKANPCFEEIRAMCSCLLPIFLKRRIVHGIRSGNGATVRWYAERMIPEYMTLKQKQERGFVKNEYGEWVLPD